MNYNYILWPPPPPFNMSVIRWCKCLYQSHFDMFMVQWFHYPQKCISYTARHLWLYLWRWPLFGKKIGKWDSCIVIIYIPRNTCMQHSWIFLWLKISSLNRRQCVILIACSDLGRAKNYKTHVYGFFGIDLHKIQFFPHPKTLKHTGKCGVTTRPKWCNRVSLFVYLSFVLAI